MQINKRLIQKGKKWLQEYFRLSHHGVKGQKWGVKNGPPYPIKRSGNSMFVKSSVRNEVKKALESGSVKLELNQGHQLKHTKSQHVEGKSYLDGDLEFAEELIQQLSGTGEVLIHGSKGWMNKEMVVADHEIGVCVDPDTGKERRTNKAMIIYSNKGSHIMPRR